MDLPLSSLFYTSLHVLTCLAAVAETLRPSCFSVLGLRSENVSCGAAVGKKKTSAETKLQRVTFTKPVTFDQRDEILTRVNI